MRSTTLLRLMIFLVSGLMASALITLYLGAALALLARAVIILPLFTLAIMALFALAKLVFHVSRNRWSMFRLVQWQGNLFWLWQVLHTGLWTALAILLTWGLTSLFGTTLLIMALNAALSACGLYGLAGCITIAPTPALGICWRDLPTIAWREAITFSENVLLLSRRLRVQRSSPAAYRDYQRLHEIVWEHRTGMDLGGQVLELDDQRPLPIRFLFEFGNRARALLPIFVSTFVIGLLLFLIFGGLLTDLGRANADLGNFRPPTQLAGVPTLTPTATPAEASPAILPTPEATQENAGASPSPEGTPTPEASATGQGGGSQSGTQTAETSATGQGSSGSQGGTQTAEASATGQNSGGSQSGTQTAEVSASGQGSSGSQGGTQTAEASATGQGSGGGSQSGTQTAEASATGQGSGGSQSGTQTAEASATGQGGGSSQNDTQTAEASATGQGNGGRSQSGTQTVEASATGQGSGGSQSGTQTAEASATGQGNGGGLQSGTQTVEASATGQGSGGQVGQAMTIPPGVTASAQVTAQGQGSGAGQGAITGTPQLEGSQPPLISTPQSTIALPRNSGGRVIIEIPPIESSLTATGVATQMVPMGTPSPQGTAPRSTGAFVTPQPSTVSTWTPVQLLPNWIRALLTAR